MRMLGRLAHGVYTIVATYLLGWVLLFATVGYGLHGVTDLFVAQWGFERPDLWWRYVDAHLPVSAIWLRLAGYGTVSALGVYLLRSPLRRLQYRLEQLFDVAIDTTARVADRWPRLAVTLRAGFTLVVTAVLVPFLLQPTLVTNWTTGRSWLERAANLADGTASVFVVDSVVGTYRRLVVEEVDSSGGVTGGEVDRAVADRPTNDDPKTPAPPPTPTGDRPMMDRWDPLIEQITDEDPHTFAFVKAFMWVESGGRQFAVSHTGCAGLMQFCSGTARTSPFREVFGRGAVYTCSCDGPCDTPSEVIRALETGDPGSVDDLDTKFPCDLTDTRFHARRSIEAGRRYIDRLAGQFDDNLYLMYIGYNSGPAVARRVWEDVGADPAADLTDIEPHLADAMRPYFAESADRRARSLLQTHLPKLRRAYERYEHETRRASLGQQTM